MPVPMPVGSRASAPELANAGVANIMAYSWFSHCEKYLKALEYEKRFMKKQKVTVLFRSMQGS